MTDELRSVVGAVFITRVPDPRVDNDEFWDRVRQGLLALVPFRHVELAGASQEEVERAREEAVEVIAHKADVFLFPKKGQRPTGVLSALATAMALCARAEGGITHLGVHACVAPHEGCPK